MTGFRRVVEGRGMRPSVTGVVFGNKPSEAGPALRLIRAPLPARKHFLHLGHPSRERARDPVERDTTLGQRAEIPFVLQRAKGVGLACAILPRIARPSRLSPIPPHATSEAGIDELQGLLACLRS